MQLLETFRMLGNSFLKNRLEGNTFGKQFLRPLETIIDNNFAFMGQS